MNYMKNLFLQERVFLLSELDLPQKASGRKFYSSNPPLFAINILKYINRNL